METKFEPGDVVEYTGDYSPWMVTSVGIVERQETSEKVRVAWVSLPFKPSKEISIMFCVYPCNITKIGHVDKLPTD